MTLYRTCDICRVLIPMDLMADHRTECLDNKIEQLKAENTRRKWVSYDPKKDDSLKARGHRQLITDEKIANLYAGRTYK